MDHQALAHVVKFGDFVKCLPLSPLGALGVARVQQGQVMRLARNRGRDAGVHPSAQQDYRLGSPTHGMEKHFRYILGCNPEPWSLYAASGWMPDEFMNLQS